MYLFLQSAWQWFDEAANFVSSLPMAYARGWGWAPLKYDMLQKLYYLRKGY